MPLRPRNPYCDQPKSPLFGDLAFCLSLLCLFVCTQVVCGHLNSSLPPFIQQQQLCRLQHTYPDLRQEIINLPPIICLSDGEELLPYKGHCSLQLRHPEQQLELVRAAVHAPPNRTVFDGDFIDIYIHSKSVKAPSSNSVTDDGNVRTEEPPPSYIEVMGDYPGPHSNNAPPTDNGSWHGNSQIGFGAGSSESTTTSTVLNRSS